METLDSDKPKDFDLDPEMMLGSGLDQNMTDDCGLDLTKTMDFALFQNVCCELFPYRSQESIARFVKRKESERFPSLCVVLYKDLVKTAWGWDRLLPWMSGYVLFEDYFRYLRRYFLENARCITELHTAATECVDAENELRTTIGAPGGLITIGNDHFELSKRINAKANDLINVPTDPDHDTIPVACFMCITEEAKLMSEVFTKWTAEADKGSAKLWQKKFEFSNEVRKAAFDILTTYRGPYFSQVSAPLLGMKREAAVAFELLRGHDVDSEEAYICEEIREFTLKLLRSICKRFPQDSAIEYCPIDRARAIMRKKHTKHLAEPSKDFVSADEDNINGTAILNSPITSKSTVRAAPSSWESYPEKNYKIKFYGKLNEKSTGSYKCGIELNTMEYCGIDPETMEDCGLDLNKTMDFALFQGVCCRLVFPSRSHESMERLIKWKESEDIKRLPPLSVVLYNDLVKTAWGWDRLLPWMTGYVLFEDYFCYLEQYFKENASCITKHHTAATDCLAAENELSTSIGAHGGLIAIGDDHFELSKRIKAKANDLINAPTYPAHDTVRVACFMCITEEAKVMSEVFTKWTAEAHKGSAEFWQKEFEFSNEVRKAAFEILTTYRGPYSGQVSAPLLGMKREAAVAFELLRGHDVDSEEAYICEEIREFTLELLRIICKRFPKDSAIEYFPIDHARAIMRKKHTELLAEPSKDFVSADEDNINGTAILNSPITSKSTVRAAPSSWSEQDNINNKKMKSMGLFQDTIMPNIQSPDPEKHSGAADKFGVPNLVTALETSVPSAPRKSYPEKNYKIKFYGKLKEKPTGSYKCGIELNTMEYCGIDPETMEDCCLDRAIMRKKHTEHLAESSKDIVSADEVSPDNIDGIAIPNSPITSVSPVLAVPSSWSEQDNMNNKKMKSMRLSQDNDTPSTQSVDLGKYNGTADSSLTPVTVFGHLHSLNTKAVSRSTENADDKK